jgi:hypothetical protein
MQQSYTPFCCNCGHNNLCPWRFCSQCGHNVTQPLLPSKCTNCNVNQPNPGYKWCEPCFKQSRISNQRVFSTPRCSNCNVNPPNPGRKWCEGCFQNSKGQQLSNAATQKISVNVKSVWVSHLQNGQIVDASGLLRWIQSPFKSVTSNNIYILSAWENCLMDRKNSGLSFWFPVSDIANANNISQNNFCNEWNSLVDNMIITSQSKINNNGTIRCANNNCDMLNSNLMAKWIHTYLNTYYVYI